MPTNGAYHHPGVGDAGMMVKISGKVSREFSWAGDVSGDLTIVAIQQ